MLESTMDIYGKIQELQEAQEVIKNAFKASKFWRSEVDSYVKANNLYEVGRNLRDNADFVSDHFEYYANNGLPISIVAKNRDGKVLLLILNEYSYTILCAIISAAIASGYAVIIVSNDRKLLHIENAFQQAHMPKGLFSVVSAFETNHYNKVSKIVYVGHKEEATAILKQNLSIPFSFLEACKTGVLLLETCDLHSAIDKILTQTWGSNFDNYWGVSTVVIEESIYETFLKLLKFKMQNFEFDNKQSRFDDKHFMEYFEKLKQNAKNSGAEILQKNEEGSNYWNPTFLLENYDQNSDTFGAVINIMTCRTAREGVAMLNNSPLFVAISVWTENLSQALEVASSVLCNSVWINCHGCMFPSVSFQSHNFVIGGINGLLQHDMEPFSVLKLDEDEDSNNISEILGEEIQNNKKNFFSIVESALKAFKFWKLEKNKKTLLKKIADLFKFDGDSNSSCYKVYLEMKNKIESSCKIKSCSSDYCLSKFYVIEENASIGIIAIYLGNIENHYKETLESEFKTNFIKNFVGLLTLTLMYGNGIILIGEATEELLWIINKFTKLLPNNLLQVVTDKDATCFFAHEQQIQDFWIYNCCGIEQELFFSLKKNWTSINKTFFKTSELRNENSTIHHFLEFQRKQIIIPKIDQFP